MAQIKGSAKDRQAIRKVQNDFAAAWNQADTKAMAGLWAENGDLINPFGREAKGRKAIEKLFAEERSTLAKDTNFAVRVRAVRFLKPDVVVVDCAWEVAGIHGADGSELPPLKGLYTAVMSKKQGQWQIAASRPMVPVAPPV